MSPESTDPTAARPHLAAWLTLAGVVLTVGGGLGGAVINAHAADAKATPTPTKTVTEAGPTVLVTPTPPEPIHPDVITPLPEATMDVCTIVTGKLPPIPKGKALIVAQRVDREKRIYFSNELDLTKPGLWSTMVYLGDRTKPKEAESKHFSIWAIVVDQSFVDYSFGANIDGDPIGPKYWNAVAFLPGLDPGTPVRVVGSGKEGDCDA